MKGCPFKSSLKIRKTKSIGTQTNVASSSSDTDVDSDSSAEFRQWKTILKNECGGSKNKSGSIFTKTETDHESGPKLRDVLISWFCPKRKRN